MAVQYKPAHMPTVAARIPYFGRGQPEMNFSSAAYRIGLENLFWDSVINAENLWEKHATNLYDFWEIGGGGGDPEMEAFATANFCATKYKFFKCYASKLIQEKNGMTFA